MHSPLLYFKKNTTATTMTTMRISTATITPTTAPLLSPAEKTQRKITPRVKDPGWYHYVKSWNTEWPTPPPFRPDMTTMDDWA